jgi:hypothetical protein
MYQLPGWMGSRWSVCFGSKRGIGSTTPGPDGLLFLRAQFRALGSSPPGAPQTPHNQWVTSPRVPFHVVDQQPADMTLMLGATGVG